MLHHTKGEELKLHIPTANELHSSYAQAVSKEVIIMAKVLD